MSHFAVGDYPFPTIKFTILTEIKHTQWSCGIFKDFHSPELSHRKLNKSLRLFLLKMAQTCYVILSEYNPETPNIVLYHEHV